MPIETFSLQIERWSNNAKAKMDVIVRKLALDMFSGVVLMSPVDTGRFRGNWQVRIGTIPTGYNVNTFDKSGQKVIQAIQSEVQQYKAGQVIYLVNHLPYARALEFGHSKQAPNGMVRVTAARFRPIVEQLARA